MENNFRIKRDHCYSHLKKNKVLTHIFKCLVCEINCRKSCDLYGMLRHLRSKPHEIKVPQVNVHYADRSSHYELQTQIIMDECFGHNNTFKKTEYNWEKKHSSSEITCSSCNILIKNTTDEKSEHCLKHLTEKDEHKWFYRCLTCSKYTSCMLDDIVKHLTDQHKVDKPEVGLHFFDRRQALQEVIQKEMSVYFEESTVLVADNESTFQNLIDKERLACF